MASVSRAVTSRTSRAACPGGLGRCRVPRWAKTIEARQAGRHRGGRTGNAPAEVMTLPPYVRVDGVPANESLRHFLLKWAAYRVLTHELGCPFALVEADVRAGAASRARLPRHDALGVRFRVARSPSPWEEIPSGRVRMELLDPRTGRWREAAAIPEVFADQTLRAFECLPGGGEEPLRAVAAGRQPGAVRVRRSGGQRRELAQLCGADAKQSRADLHAWLREADRRLKGVTLFVIVAPAGLVAAEDLPPRVGLAAVDLDRIVDEAGQPAIRMVRWPEMLRPALRWAPERTAEFQRHAYYAMHGLFERQLFWFLAQVAVDRRRAAATLDSGSSRGEPDAVSPSRGVPGSGHDEGLGRQ